MKLADLPVRVIRLANIHAAIDSGLPKASCPFQRPPEINDQQRDMILRALADMRGEQDAAAIARKIAQHGINAHSVGRTCHFMRNAGLIVARKVGVKTLWGLPNQFSTLSDDQ